MIYAIRLPTTTNRRSCSVCCCLRKICQLLFTFQPDRKVFFFTNTCSPSFSPDAADEEQQHKNANSVV